MTPVNILYYIIYCYRRVSGYYNYGKSSLFPPLPLFKLGRVWPSRKSKISTDWLMQTAPTLTSGGRATPPIEMSYFVQSCSHLSVLSVRW